MGWMGVRGLAALVMGGAALVLSACQTDSGDWPAGLQESSGGVFNNDGQCLLNDTAFCDRARITAQANATCVSQNLSIFGASADRLRQLTADASGALQPNGGSGSLNAAYAVRRETQTALGDIAQAEGACAADRISHRIASCVHEEVRRFYPEDRAPTPPTCDPDGNPVPTPAPVANGGDCPSGFTATTSGRCRASGFGCSCPEAVSAAFVCNSRVNPLGHVRACSTPVGWRVAGRVPPNVNEEGWNGFMAQPGSDRRFLCQASGRTVECGDFGGWSAFPEDLGWEVEIARAE